jgi:hypothetical protein
VFYRSCQFSTSCLNCARKGSKSDFKNPDVAAHHAEMGNLLSLNPKIHRLRADAKENRSFPHTDGQFTHDGDGRRFDCRFHEILVAPVWRPQILRKWERQFGTFFP